MPCGWSVTDRRGRVLTCSGEHPQRAPVPGARVPRDPVRRLRGRLGGAVSLWTSGTGVHRAGLTVSSLMVAPGEPGRVLGLVDPDSDLALAVEETGTAVVQLLSWEHRDLADVFAGVAPAPGGAFRSATWEETRWGPVLAGVSAWAGIRVAGGAPPSAGRCCWTASSSTSRSSRGARTSGPRWCTGAAATSACLTRAAVLGSLRGTGPAAGTTRGSTTWPRASRSR